MDVDAESGDGGRRWPLAVAGVVVLAFVLRVWGAGHGLPYVYNPDEYGHFVWRAVLFHANGNFDPDYFVNPPAFSYLLYAVLGLRFGGSEGVVSAFAESPGDVFLAARWTAAALGALSVLLVYVAGARLLGRRTGLLAAALLAVAFLPVFQAHQALNDVPTTAAIGLSLVGAAGVLRRGRLLDYAVAGAGFGLACATKYPGGVVLLSLLVAAACHARIERGRALAGLGLALGTAAAAFLVANPYAAFDAGEFLGDAGLRSTKPGGGGKLGQAEESGLVYYLWTATWGLGWVPALAALGGAVALLRQRTREGLVLVLPVALLLVALLGLQDRWFARWLLPAFPFLVLLAAYGALRAAGVARRLGPRAAAAATAAAVVLLLAQGLVKSVHLDLVLSREDARNQARDWLVANVPAGTPLALEPIAPVEWSAVPGAAPLVGDPPSRWRLYPLEDALRELVARGDLSREDVPGGRVPRRIGPPRYTLYLHPEVLDVYEERGVCWVVTGGSQSGRAFAEPEEAPGAIAYYRELERRGQLVFRATPFRAGADPIPFNFDWSNDFYPFAYERPGYETSVYHLRGGACG